MSDLEIVHVFKEKLVFGTLWLQYIYHEQPYARVDFTA
jgi:hypothetical protein